METRPAIKQYLSSISISQGNSTEVTNIIFTTEYLTGRLWARASVISTSFAKVSFSRRTSFPLALYNYKLIHFPRTLLTITVPEIQTTGGTTPIITHCATRAEFLHHSTYEAVSLMPLWLMNRNVFIKERHSARVSYSLSTICLLQLKCNTRNVTR